MKPSLQFFRLLGYIDLLTVQVLCAIWWVQYLINMKDGVVIYSLVMMHYFYEQYVALWLYEVWPVATYLNLSLTHA